ncbi:N-acetyl-gamma-glutamyl-phosphate reductase [Tengunoibacter tsumagoiensis]|uniref:Putative [LysW]-L-2-aminoadipate 6-phosphate reductase n=1 Tax=Tengunoibacter tsumagoiensis TaxID=2014871 RepID=A0A402A3J5_9CHLR|nr:N-acetyl-gamma-glutamyl-phosphate reductase [Tengunoibacter tsumagoiensis]GCE13714.1 N-acetyl-gamma-glutamyl-phosphate reductase [Tengunoibacter tsumagoiensis]
MSRVRVSIVGGSGYTGGELARILLFHPQVELTQVASGGHAGQFLHSTHPNLRKLTTLRYCHPDDLTSCDVLFLCLPHGASAGAIERYRGLAPRIIDLSADFRLRSPELYARWYGHEHSVPALLSEAVYGLPELHRAELAEATLVSGTGCSATTAILGLAPLYRAGIVNQQLPLVVEAKFGSSAAGATPGAGSHHPDRSGAVRSFEPTGHRHSAELIQELGLLSHGANLQQTVAFSATAIELVRGILVTAHVFTSERIEEKALWKIYREAYGREPFIRLVKEKTGVYRYPEPKILAGSNFCDIGFEVDADQQRIVVIAALDNLMKGAAGNGVQVLNSMFGWDETVGLSFPGLHPV